MLFLIVSKNCRQVCLLVFFFTVVVSLFAQKRGLTYNGYQYINYTNKVGKRPQVGNFAFCHISVYCDDSLTNSTHLPHSSGIAIPVLVQEKPKSTSPNNDNYKGNPVAVLIEEMVVGDSASVEVPIDSLMRLSPSLKDVKSLQYHVVLMNIMTDSEYSEYMENERVKREKKQAKYKVREEPTKKLLTGIINDYKEGKLEGKLVATQSGLKYLLLKEGSGPIPRNRDKISALYFGMLNTGIEFDNSYKRGNPFNFRLGEGQVIKGWDEGLALFNKGSKFVLFIPPHLGYGDQANANIPANSELIFFIDTDVEED